MHHLIPASLLASLTPSLDSECMPTNATLLSALEWVLGFADSILHITITWSC